jgi:GntR family transcriptional regulator / MocR family aminotransferase
MRPWSFPVALEPQRSEPLFLQIARVVADDVRRGRLVAGATLPGSRTLARTLGVNRNTVVAAFRELEAQGWLRPEGHTTRIADDVPLSAAAGTAPAGQLGFPLGPPPLATPFRGVRSRPGELHLCSGSPDLRLFPTAELARAYRRALEGQRGRRLDYGDRHGERSLRVGLAAMLRETRGLACDERGLIVAGGTQGALELVARALIRPGDVVAIENPGYPPAWAAFAAAGATLVPVPVDEDGMVVEALEAIARRRPRLRAVYATPHHQFPTTVTMSLSRRAALLELARARRLAVVEDDYDFEFAYDRRPVLPLAAADPGGVVVYVGTLSKILAPSLRIGWVVGPPAFVADLKARRVAVLQQNDRVVERAVAELLEDGVIARHARKLRRIYRARRDVLADALRRHFPAARFTVPSGGMSIWVSWGGTAPAGDFFGAEQFWFGGEPGSAAARLGFSSLDEPELREAVRRLATTSTSAPPSPRRS